MNNISSYTDLSIAIDQLNPIIDQATSGKALKTQVAAVFERVQTITGTEQQKSACETKLSALNSKLQTADTAIEARCWKQMGRFERVGKSILWGLSYIAKIWGGSTYRASTPLDVQSLVATLNTAKAKFKVTSEQLRKPLSPLKKEPPAATIVVQHKAVVLPVPLEAPRAIEAPKVAPSERDKLLQKLDTVIAEESEYVDAFKCQIPNHIIQIAFARRMIARLSDLRQQAAAEEDPQKIAQLLEPVQLDEYASLYVNHCMLIDTIDEAYEHYEAVAKELLANLPQDAKPQKLYLQQVLEQQLQLKAEINQTTHPEKYKNYRIPAKKEIEVILRANLKFMETESALQALHLDHLPQTAKNNSRFREHWTELHTILTSKLESIRSNPTTNNAKRTVTAINKTIRQMQQIPRGLDATTLRRKDTALLSLLLLQKAN